MILVSGQDHTATGKPGSPWMRLPPISPDCHPSENKELCVRFAGGRLSSDGGVLVLREIEKRLGLAARLAGCLSDARDPASTTHSYADMIGARMFAIACGYEDCDDLDVLRFDPAFKLACGRLPEERVAI